MKIDGVSQSLMAKMGYQTVSDPQARRSASGRQLTSSSLWCAVEYNRQRTARSSRSPNRFVIQSMKLISQILCPLLFVFGAATAQELDYSRVIHLDAEDLAEQGMAEGYLRLLPELKAYVAVPLVLTEKVDSDRGHYTVFADGFAQRISPSPLGGDEYESWGVATAALFKTVNRQLGGTSVKFYALNSGNDLMGIFLTERQATAARKTIKRRSDWPYLPTMQAPWFGQYH